MGKEVKLLVMDVDGTLTNGKVNIGEHGELFKAFDVKDGYGIHEILPKYDISCAIITGRSSKIVEVRAQELEIDYVYQNIKDKVAILKNIMNELEIGFHQVAYIGDDINDLECMELCGYTGCPSDAVQSVKNASQYISNLRGGEGAVRDFIEWLVEF